MSGRNINGEGSVYQRKDGRWVAAAYVPVVGGGVRRQALYARTRAEASKKLRELLDRAEKHQPVAPTSLTVGAYLDEWLIHVKQHVRSSTWVAYEGNVRLHLKPRIGKKKLVRLGVRDVRLMVDGMRSDEIGTRTIQYVHATLRAALEHAYREELVSRNVAKLVRVERPKPAVKEPLTVEEARKLLDGTTTDRFHALWVLLLMLGLRRSEACGLRWEHVDFAARTLRISQTVQRVDGNSPRVADEDPALEPNRAASAADALRPRRAPPPTPGTLRRTGPALASGGLRVSAPGTARHWNRGT
jgi:integrase